MRAFRNVTQETRSTVVFKQEWIRSMQDTNRYYSSDAYQRYLFTSIDPSGGGQYSDYVILSAFYTEDHVCVVCSIIILLPLHRIECSIQCIVREIYHR